MVEASKIPFEILSVTIENPKSVTKQIEQQTIPPLVLKETIETPHLVSRTKTYSSSSYANITRKKPPKSLGSSEDECFERH